MKEPVVSVIICTYNRCESIKDTLNSLLIQECNGSFDYQVIVVDNNSSDKTRITVEHYAQQFSGKLKYIFEPKQGKSYALNTGIKNTTGGIIAFTDDDVILDRKWLLNIFLCFQSYDCDGIGGRVLPLYPDKTPRWIIKNNDLLSGPIPIHNYGKENIVYSKHMSAFIGANIAVKKCILNEIGYFRVDLGLGTGTKGEETELFRRIQKANKKLYYCGSALCLHKVNLKQYSLKYIAKWNIDSGRYYVTKGVSGNISLISYWGIPRYLIKQTFNHSLGLFTFIVNMRKFLINWNKLFICLGMIVEYRKIYKCLK